MCFQIPRDLQSMTLLLFFSCHMKSTNLTKWLSFVALLLLSYSNRVCKIGEREFTGDRLR